MSEDLTGDRDRGGSRGGGKEGGRRESDGGAERKLMSSLSPIASVSVCALAQQELKVRTLH